MSKIRDTLYRRNACSRVRSCVRAERNSDASDASQGDIDRVSGVSLLSMRSIVSRICHTRPFRSHDRRSYYLRTLSDREICTRLARLVGVNTTSDKNYYMGV